MTRLQQFLVVGFLVAVTGCSDGEDAGEGAGDTQAPAQSTAPTPADEAGKPAPIRVDTRTEGGGFDPVKAYDAKCPADDDDAALECEWLRGLVMADVVDALDAIADARDQRGTEEALAALDVDDEPELLIAACRVLGRFPDTPGIAEKLTPLLLDSPYLEVQRIAAEVLARNPDTDLAAVAQQWSANHAELVGEDPYQERPGLPPDYTAMGFPDYPGAVRFTPADSDRSVGWATTDPVATVVDRLSSTLGTQPMELLQWQERSQQEMMNAYQSIDEAKVEQMQKLIEEFTTNQDPALMERVEALRNEIYAPMEQLGESSQLAPTQVATPPGSADFDQVRYLIAEEKNGHVARLILVYRQKSPDRTVMQMAWDLRDYARAWPTEPASD